VLLIVCAGLLAACGSDGPVGGVDATSSAGSAPGAAATNAAGFAPPSDAEAERALEHVRVLAGDIGSRATGTPNERRAAEYIRDQLEAAGYTVTIEPFTVDIPRDDSRVLGVPDTTGGMVTALAMTGAPDGEASGRVVQVGLGRAEDFAGLDLRGAVAFADRGVASFRDKAVNAQRAGAVALVVANNQQGPFRGSIASGPEAVTIPVVGVTSDGAALIDEAVGEGSRITVRVSRTSEPFESQNVVGQPSADPCTAYVGAHYDSVPQGPGANDNASGTGSVLELARTHRVPGLCYLAFGAEEVGLYGSAAFVRDHHVGSERFMLNLDMMGKIRGPVLIAGADEGSTALGTRASSIAGTAGIALPLGSFGPFASSDHVSFARVGVPAVTFYAGDDEFIHTARDNLDNVALEDLRTMLKAAAAVLRELLAAER
jgi:Iap family predicted aminopeptidase